MSKYVNRVAQLCNLVSKPELNGVYVTIESYNRAKDRYAIRTLVPPNSTAEVVSILVKLSSLNFIYPTDFATRYPYASTQRGAFELRAYFEGTIFDFATSVFDAAAAEKLGEQVLTFQWSCRIVGVPTASLEELTTVFPCTTGTLFEGPGKDVIVEFENIHFTAPDQQMVLGHAKLTKFKNCRFSNVEAALTVSDGSTAVLENCLFENCSEYAMRIEDENSHATILNCTFRNCSPAVRVLRGGAVNVIHCTFDNCMMVVYAGPKSPDVRYINCSATGGGSISVMIVDGCKGHIKGNYWQGCNWEAVKVEGPKRSTVVVEDCVIRECKYGVGAKTGKVDLKVINTRIEHCPRFGIHMMDNTIGTIEISGCEFANNQRDIANACGELCAVTIDGVLQKTDDYDKRIAIINREIQEQNNSVLINKPGAQRGRPALKVLRAHKLTGTGCVRCAKCTRLEPDGVKFDMCSRCKNVCYCTRECQVAHWKAVHKAECGTIDYV